MAWRITGGWKANVRSADFWLSLVVWAICYHFWLEETWWEQVISVLPNLLGFTLGGFAIFLGFGSDAFRGVISDADEKKSPYISVSAAFLIFVSMQVFALLFAFCAKAVHFETPQVLAEWKAWIKYGDVFASGLGYFIFIYSIALALRSAVRIFRLSRWYHEFIVIETERAEEKERKLDVEI
jgi:hypothetical protein